MAFQSLSDLRKSRGGFDALMKEVDKIANPSSDNKNVDERFGKQPQIKQATVTR